MVPTTLPPKARIDAAVKRYGEDDVVACAISLMGGNRESDDFLLYLGGEHAQGILDGAPVLYWPELWGTRALLHAWDDATVDAAVVAVIDALRNPAWRVREMAARVVVARDIPAAEDLIPLLTDETPRVRIAGAKALGEVGSMDQMEDIKALLKDPLIEVRRGAREATVSLRKRFPRSAPAGS